MWISSMHRCEPKVYGISEQLRKGILALKRLFIIIKGQQILGPNFPIDNIWAAQIQSVNFSSFSSFSY